MQKLQLYDQLSLNIMNKNMNETVNNVKDLSLIKGEINNLVSFCVELYSKYYLSRNVLFVRKLCTDIQALTNITRKNITSNSVFNHHS